MSSRGAVKIGNDYYEIEYDAYCGGTALRLALKLSPQNAKELLLIVNGTFGSHFGYQYISSEKITESLGEFLFTNEWCYNYIVDLEKGTVLDVPDCSD